MSLFKKSQKSPAEVVKSLVSALTLLEKHHGEKKAEKALIIFLFWNTQMDFDNFQTFKSDLKM